MTDHPKVYTTETLAERWSYSPQHIRDLIAKGDVACFRLGRLLRIPAAEVERIESEASFAGEGATPPSSEPTSGSPGP